MNARRRLMTLTAVLLAGCGSVRETAHGPAAIAPVADAAPFDTRLPLPEFMAHVMQHAADGIWKWQGVVLDAAGEHALDPRTDEEWEEAESGALTLAETTNLLLIPGRRVADPGWDAAAANVRRIALEAAAGAEAHDQPRFFAAGAALNAACDGCHERFDPNYEPPPR